ncbi:DUF4291 family protein [Kitasatospora sp. NPDC088160]|uniref:DUF4291 family protein n=1 Tax=Kitasatospora sp. NPDC088160 TaxID=3364072 RepID=UPI0038158E08
MGAERPGPFGTRRPAPPGSGGTREHLHHALTAGAAATAERRTSGLAGEAAERYAEQWIVSIDNVTALAHTVQAQVRDGALDAARQLLPAERPYPAGDALLNHLRG